MNHRIATRLIFCDESFGLTKGKLLPGLIQEVASDRDCLLDERFLLLPFVLEICNALPEIVQARCMTLNLLPKG